MTSRALPERAASLSERAREWIEGDPDFETRRELEALLDSERAEELRERMDSPLRFGTAGLRGLVGAGPGRMNRAVVIRTTRALADHLHAKVPDARTLPVVVGFDARLTSRRFASDVAGVLSAAGMVVRYFPSPAPTPLVVYAQRQLAATAAVVITASHNPPEYNGYKLYGPEATQITTPIDVEIERRSDTGGKANAIPLDEGALERRDDSVAPVPDSIVDRYVAEVLSLRPPGGADRSLRIVYTPLHGVAGALARRVLRDAGFDSVQVVPDQAEPDGRFPTVRFPNPEEPEALASARALAERTRADLVLANDPDGDRLAAVVPTPSGRWVTLTGNQVGLLLAEQALDAAPPAPRPLLVSTIVSSPLLGVMAERRGARFERTLTGFKWIWRAALALEDAEGVRFCFGYEQALGYSPGRTVRDKDGVSAAYLFAELAAQCKASGQSVLERLGALYRRYGLWASVEKSIVRPGIEGARAIRLAVDRMATETPREVEGERLLSCTDYRSGGEERPPWLHDDAVVEWTFESGARVLARPSGTEPKLKLYADVSEAVAPAETIGTAEERAKRRAAKLLDALVRFVAGS